MGFNSGFKGLTSGRTEKKVVQYLTANKIEYYLKFVEMFA